MVIRTRIDRIDGMRTEEMEGGSIEIEGMIGRIGGTIIGLGMTEREDDEEGEEGEMRIIDVVDGAVVIGIINVDGILVVEEEGDGDVVVLDVVNDLIRCLSFKRLYGLKFLIVMF